MVYAAVAGAERREEAITYQTGFTLGQFLQALRGFERPSDVQRRMARQGRDITSRYITMLENDAVKEPGTVILETLADAYQGRLGWERDALFWHLWQLAGYPLPPGYAEMTPDVRRLVVHFLKLDTAGREAMIQEARERAGEHQGQEGRGHNGPAA